MKKILDLLSYVAFALVVASVGLRFQTFRPAWQEYAARLALAGLVVLFVYAISQWREIAGMFSRRQARYGTLSAVSVLVVLGILIGVNFIAKRQSKRWDLTANQQFSLADQSRNVLAKLDAPLEIRVFTQDADFQRFRDRLTEYEYGSPQVTTEYIDPDKKPALAQQYEVQQYGTILFTHKGRTERVSSDTEQDITNAIIKVVTGAQKKVYFTQGHGEKDFTSAERDGYNAIADALGKENYTVDKVVLAQTGSVPDDAAVMIAAGPQTDFLPNEIDALKKYLANTGKLFLALDPPQNPASPPMTNLIALAREWGIDVTNSIVVDASGMGRLIGTDASVPVAATYPPHPITERFTFLTAYPLARAIVPISGGVEGRVAQTVVESSPRSWAEADIKALLASGEVSQDETKGDKPGPVSLAAAVSAVATASDPPKTDESADAPKPETRVVVYGDSDFAANGGLGIQGNRDLFLNTIGWLSQQENLISIRPKEPADRRLTLTADQHNIINWLALAIIPGAILGLGVYSWWRRR